jgi:hypothetical protein
MLAISKRPDIIDPDAGSETLCFLAFRILDDGQIPETLIF